MLASERDWLGRAAEQQEVKQEAGPAAGRRSKRREAGVPYIQRDDDDDDDNSYGTSVFKSCSCELGGPWSADSRCSSTTTTSFSLRCSMAI